MKLQGYQSIADVKEDPVVRIPTGIEDIDWIYGVTQGWHEDVFHSVWGLPEGKLSVWVAPGGTGKSRALIELAKSVSSVMPPGSKGERRYSVLYFQGEAPLGEFKSWATKGGIEMDPNFFMVSDANTLTSQLRAIRDMNNSGMGPNLVIVDSINMLQEFGNGTKAAMTEIIMGAEGREGYKGVAREVGCHVIFVSQTNKNGDASGSNSLPHLVDQTFYVEKERGSSLFTITTGKSRYSKSDTVCQWQHLDDCAKCVSANRVDDEVWVNGRKKYRETMGYPDPCVSSPSPQNNYEANLLVAQEIQRKQRRQELYGSEEVPQLVEPLYYDYGDDIYDCDPGTFGGGEDDSPLAECERTLNSASNWACLGLAALARSWSK